MPIEQTQVPNKSADPMPGPEPLTVALKAGLPADGGIQSLANNRSSSIASGSSGAGLAMRLSTELVVATMIGAGMGYLLDHWLHTGPWLTVVFLFFGAAAGVRNLYRIVNSDLAST